MRLSLHKILLLSVIFTCDACFVAIPAVGGMVLPGMMGLSSFVDPASKSLSRSKPQDVHDEPAVGTDSEVPEIMNELVSGKRLDISSTLSDDLDGSDETLARFERGRLAQIQGEPAVSVSEFEHAIQNVKDFDERAHISAREVGAQAAAVLINDNLIPYEPSGFERVLAYHFQALNYLMEGKVEEAGVEVRRANLEQELALKAHETELAEAEEAAQKKGFKTADLQAELFKGLGDSRQVAAQAKNSFQNAYTFYMSGIVHEVIQEPNDAYIDYKKALEIAPTNTVIQRDVARLAKALSMNDDIGRYSKQFPNAFLETKTIDKEKSEVIVLFEDGVVPGKQAMWLPIPIPIPNAPGLTSIAIPTFRASVAPIHPLTLQDGSGTIAKSERICSIDALAVKAYEEGAPAMITRQVIRAALKGAASSLASQYTGGLAGIAVSALGVATEIADTRSWRSLPQNAQVMRARVKPGATLTFAHDGSGASGTLAVPNDPGKLVVIRAIRLGSKLFLTSVTL